MTITAGFFLLGLMGELAVQPPTPRTFVVSHRCHPLPRDAADGGSAPYSFSNSRPLRIHGPRQDGGAAARLVVLRSPGFASTDKTPKRPCNLCVRASDAESRKERPLATNNSNRNRRPPQNLPACLISRQRVYRVSPTMPIFLCLCEFGFIS